MTQWLRRSGVVACLVLQACLGTSPYVASTPSDTATIPTENTEVSEILLEAMEAAVAQIEQTEKLALSNCEYSPDVNELIEGSIKIHNEALLQGKYGRGVNVVSTEPSLAKIPSSVIQATACMRDPICDGKERPCSDLNAFALANTTFALQPLFYSFIEGAGFWGQLIEKAGGDPSKVDEEELIYGLGNIYYAQAQGKQFATVDLDTVKGVLQRNPYVMNGLSGVIAFVMVHEYGHANLQHSAIKGTVLIGLEAILKKEGKQLTKAELEELQQEFQKIAVYSETQADIYAATLVKRMGYDSSGPRVLFNAGMVGYKVAAGVCNSAANQQEYSDCLLGKLKLASHPPLDVRASIMKRIMDDGEDMTSKLKKFDYKRRR